MKNRGPAYILAALVLVALIWHIVNPPQPPPPGPMGTPPHWSTMVKVGEMGPWQVNPSGTMWAGAWNEKAKDGKLRSAVWVVDFENSKSKHWLLDSRSPVVGLSWADDNSVRVVTPAKLLNVEMTSIDANSDAPGKPKLLKDAVTQIAAWPQASKDMITAMGPQVSLTSDTGKTIGKDVSLKVAKNVRYGGNSAISPDGSQFVVSVIEDKVGSEMTYYLADTKTGASKRIFSSKDLPGRVSGLWVSPAGVLVVCSERDKFDRLICGPDGKLTPIKAKDKLDTSAWSDAPKNMKFVSYNAGYDFRLSDGRTRKLFDLKKLGRNDDQWRREVQDGRLYPRKDGDYTSVSFAAGAIDIRIIAKDGSKSTKLMPRS
ncbi:MAG: hypothetical protein ABFD54_09545 [Armatimonadota bacterium]|nr:hypothetical protein [bacterium]